MPSKTPLTLVAVAALLVGTSAFSMGFGRPPMSVTLGSALNFAQPLRLDDDEALEPQCVTAEVLFGDRRVSTFNVRVSLEPGPQAQDRIARVITAVAVDEPVVTVNITAGCIAKVSRRITVFADPPLGVSVASASQALPAAETLIERRDSEPSTASAAPVAARLPGATLTVPALVAPAALAADPPAAVSRPNRAVASAPKAQGGKQRKSTVAARRSEKPGAAARTAIKSSTARAPATGAESAGRLRLDPSTPDTGSPAALAASAAHEALAAALLSAQSAEIAASSANQRVKNLELQVDRLLNDGRQQREQVQALRTRLADAHGSQSLYGWMAGLVAVLAAVALWFGLQVRRLKHERDHQWWTAAAADAVPQPEASIDAPNALRRESDPDLVAPDLVTGPPAAPSTLSPQTQIAPVTVRLPGDIGAATAPIQRAVSVEELIDLEQQAEFFVVLGQDDSAIDLLVGHVRGSGGTSPLPYLKLLEIYRRLGDREAHDRTRDRFNQRFNAYAPDWDADMQQGRSLEDYPLIMDSLEKAWPRPLDAMTALETLLFRKDDGELFALPAYRDVLLLYSLARDLLDHQEGAPVQNVDVLLPLGEVTFEETSPRPHLNFDLVEASGHDDDVADVGRPTMALDLDLDLSEPAQPTREATRPGDFSNSSFSDSDFALDQQVIQDQRPPRKP